MARRHYDNRIVAEDRDNLVKFESSWSDFRLLLQTATDNETVTDKRRKVYARGNTVKAK